MRNEAWLAQLLLTAPCSKHTIDQEHKTCLRPSLGSPALVGKSFVVQSLTNFKSINWSDAEMNDLVHGSK